MCRSFVIENTFIDFFCTHKFRIITIYDPSNRIIDIYRPSAKTIDALMKLDLPSGVDIEVKL